MKKVRGLDTLDRRIWFNRDSRERKLLFQSNLFCFFFEYIYKVYMMFYCSHQLAYTLIRKHINFVALIPYTTDYY